MGSGNSSSSSSSTSAGIGFQGLLLILFIALKLTDVIDWSWWWVLSPLWVSAGVVVLTILSVGIYAVITTREK
jgi:hypothetical protein